MASASFGSWKTYQPSVNGPETMAGAGIGVENSEFPLLRLWRRHDNPVKVQFLACAGPLDGDPGRCVASVSRGRRTGPERYLSERGVVRFENVGLRYGLGPEVLRDLTFRIEPHSFQFLTGPSGAGKTSLLRLLFLSLKPTRGLITLFDQDVATLGRDALAALRRRTGIVFQDFRLLDHMTTFENVALPLRVVGRREASYRQEVTELLHWVGLGDR